MIVNPNTTASMTSTVVAGASTVAARTTRLIGSTAARGVASVESNVDEVWGALAVLEQVRSGEAAGVDGYVIACFGDTGLPAARETARGPVVGMSEAAVYTAALLAARFTIITLPPRTREQSHRVLRDTGLAHRCTVRAIDVPVSDLADGSAQLLDTVAAEARSAMVDDAAEAVVLGCAGLSDLVAPLTAALGVPVIDGVAAAVTMVEGLLAQGLSTSRVSTYAAPERLGPVLP
ncbi:MAG: allantoin racemase [Pseudonocardiales bacterium]|nr:allantoin racemase [Pseudonocardiales bacterium]